MPGPDRPFSDCPGAARAARRGAGFRHAARLVEERIRAAGEKRGFAVARLLTRWDEIAGPETARLARPLKLGWAGRSRGKGLGATLTLATSSAAAPLVQMMIPQIRERVNACYGYNAVARIVLTQSPEAPAGTPTPGFAEGQAAFAPAPRRSDPADAAARAAAAAAGVHDPELRAALEALARNVITRNHTAKGPET